MSVSVDNLLMHAGKSKTAQKGTANAPKATPEQIARAKLLNNSEFTEDLLNKIRQVQECTESTFDTAFSVLRDANNDVHEAIELILDHKYDDSWMDPSSKKTKAKKQNEQKSKIEKEKDQLKNGLNKSLNDKKINSSFDVPKKSGKQNGKSKNAKSTNQVKNPPSKPEKISKEGLTSNDVWTLECGEWKGETVEVVNSFVDIHVNIQEDPELLKLVTTQEVELPADNCVKNEEVPFVRIEETIEQSKEKQTEVEEPIADEENAVQRVKAKLFSTRSQSMAPPSSSRSQLPVFFAPGSTLGPLRDEASSVQFGTNYIEIPPIFKSHIFAELDLSKSKVPAASSQKPARIEPSQEIFTPAIPPHITTVAPMVQPDQTFTPIPLQQPNVAPTGVQKDSFSKIQESQTSGPHPHQSQTVNNFDKSYNYNLLSEISQNMKNVNFQDMQVEKSDAFTQSTSSNQPDNMSSASYQFPPSKPPVGGMPQQGQPMNKPISVIPPSTGGPPQLQQTVPTTQAAALPQALLHFPHLMNHIQQNMPFFNFPQASATASPTMFDLAYHQRMLFEIQNHASASAQTIANDTSGNSVSNAVDVMASNKPNNMPQPPQPSIHQVTTANSGFFMPYGLNSGMVLMNSYPNTFMEQQQQQAVGSQAAVTQPSQNSSTGLHGASALSHTGNNQFAKPLSAPTNFSAYQNMRQSNFEEMNDIYYSNLPKQMNFKHNQANVQSYYSAPKPDMGSKAAGMSSSQQIGHGSQTQQQSGSNQVQPSNMYSQQNQAPFSFYQTQALVAAAVAAQSQSPSQANQSTGGTTGQGSSGMVAIHGRATH